MRSTTVLIAIAILASLPLLGQQNESGVPEPQMTYEEQLRRSQQQLAEQAELLEKGKELMKKQEDMIRRQEALLDKQEEQANRYDRILSAMEKQFKVGKQASDSNK